VAKFNRLLAIQQYLEEAGKTVKYWGKEAFYSIGR
jgi:hypothetical protein